MPILPLVPFLSLVRRPASLALAAVLAAGVAGAAHAAAPSPPSSTASHADSLARAEAFSKAGKAHWREGRYDSALVNLAQARAMFAALGARQRLAQELNNIGSVHYQMGQHEPALASYLTSLALRRELGDTRGIALVLANIGGTYQDWHLFDRALPILREAVGTAERLGEPFALGWALHMLGMLHVERREFDEARVAFDRSINQYAAGARARPENAYGGWALNALGLAIVAIRGGEPSRGISLVKHVLATADAEAQVVLEARALLYLGEGYRALGNRRAAIDAFTRSVRTAHTREQRVAALRALEQLADMEEAVGHHRDALAHWHAFRALRDSVFNQGAMQRVASMEAQVRLDEQLRENARLQGERAAQSLLITRQRLQVSVAATIVVAVTAILTVLALYFRDGRRRERMLAASNASLERVNEELQQALREVRTLSGLIPICARCKRVRDDRGFWEAVETYITARSAATFSHAICASCGPELYGTDWGGDSDGADPHVGRVPSSRHGST